MTEHSRFDPAHLTPTILTGLNQLSAEAESSAHEAGLDAALVELVRVRASQLNGCEFCLGLHTRQALEYGESEQRLRELVGWRESARFTDAERAALRLTEAITRLKGAGVPDEDYRAAQAQFDEKQLVSLVWTVVLINAFNRLAVTMAPAN